MAKTQIRIRQLNINFKDSVAVATTGTNITVASAAPDTLDGVNLAVGDRILVKDQTSAIENGIYEVTTLGTGANGVWDRVVGMDEGGEVRYGDMVAVIEGTVNGRKIFVQLNADDLVVGSDANNWSPLTDSDTAANHVFGETPTGTIDGSNTAFDIAATPDAGSVRVYLNGQRLKEGATEDYTLSGTTITFADAPKASPGNPDVILVDYLT